jgi:hypothetical protein
VLLVVFVAIPTACVAYPHAGSVAFAVYIAIKHLIQRTARAEAVAVATNLCAVLRIVVTADAQPRLRRQHRRQSHGRRHPNSAFESATPESERKLGQARERFSNRVSASVAKTTCTIQTNKRRIAVMVAPHLSGLLVLQSDFGPRPVLSCRHDVSDFSPKSGLWRGTQQQNAAAVPRLH